MAEGEGDGPRTGLDFSLPDEILCVIPTDPYDQLDLARKITSMAIASRVSKLEADAERLQQKLREKDRRIVELEDKVSDLQAAYQEAELRLKIMREDNIKIIKEKDSLALTTKKLGRDLAKLETFKRQLMQSLNDENSPQVEAVDIGTYDQSLPKAYAGEDEANDQTKYNPYSGSTDSVSLKNDAVSKLAGQSFPVTRYISPRFTPTGTPPMISARGSPRKSSSALSPPKTSGATSPTMHYDGRGTLSAWYPSSQQSSAASSPPRDRPLSARTPRIDGKEFFRQARSRLSLEQFSAFLTNIKELNAQRQSKEETLQRADEIFGAENKDLFVSFQRLLSRSMR